LDEVAFFSPELRWGNIEITLITKTSKIVTIFFPTLSLIPLPALPSFSNLLGKHGGMPWSRVSWNQREIEIEKKEVQRIEKKEAKGMYLTMACPTR
jgi:hypothetical protein